PPRRGPCILRASMAARVRATPAVGRGLASRPRTTRARDAGGASAGALAACSRRARRAHTRYSRDANDSGERVNKARMHWWRIGLFICLALPAQGLELHVVPDLSRVEYHITHSISDVTDRAGTVAGTAALD